MAPVIGAGGRLVEKCIDAAAATAEAVARWRRQRRTLESLPSHLADALLRRLLRRRLLYPSLLELFRYCTEEIDLTGENTVDAEWLAYIGAFRYLRTLKLADCRAVTSSSLWPISGMSMLKELDLSRCLKITDSSIKHIISIQTLEKLYLPETGLTSNGVLLLSPLINLTVLDLGGISVTDQALSSLQVLTRIEQLDLWGSEITDSGATILKSFPRLSSLNLAWTSVTTLPFLPPLKSLNMSNCTVSSIFGGAHGSATVSLSALSLSACSFEDINEAFTFVETDSIKFLDFSGNPTGKFYFLERFRILEHLDLDFSKITDDAIEHVAKIGANLKILNLKGTRVTSLGVSVLAGSVMNLVSLTLAHTDINDTALPYIALMPCLETLDISRTKIRGLTNQGRDGTSREFSLYALQDLNNLESLNLEETQIKDDALHPLATLKTLKYLYLKSDFLSDTSLYALAPLSGLKFLGFQGAVLTNLGLFSYNPPLTLETLDLRGCWLLTEDAILDFCKINPKIEVKHEMNKKQVYSSFSSIPNQVHKMGQVHRGKQKGVRKAEPSGFARANFIDERIRYTREELMELQRLAGVGSVLDVSLIPPELKRTE